MCLLASLMLSSGQMTAMAQPWDNVENTETVQQNITDAQSDIISESDIQYPEDWDPEDPQNARAYEQLMESTDTEDDSQAPVLYSADARAAAVTTTWGGKTYTHNDFNTEDCDVVPCIDVSYHQGTIDWTKVKNAGINYVILRVGYRASASGTLNNDKMFETYIKDAQKAGLKVGVYIYSQAISVKEAEAEADFTLNRIKNYTIDLPVVFDYEYYGSEEGRLYNAHLSKSAKTQCAEAFCKKVTAAGYQAMVYANASFCESELDTASLANRYQIWMARYNSYSYNASKDKGVRYGGRINYWQCSESAKVNGISTSVDFNWWYKNRNSGAGNGITYDAATDKWMYQVNGKVDTSYTGFAKNDIGWWYVEKGYITFNKNSVVEGTVNGKYGWWHVKGSQVVYDTTVAENEHGWWYIKNGMVDFSYDGFAGNEYGWWYLEGGKVSFKKNDVIEGNVNGKNGWWHVKGSKVTYDTTVAENKNGWWYIKNGMVDFSYNGFAGNEHGWWYLEGGKVSFKKNDVIEGNVNGKNGWWHVKGSKVTYDTTVAENKNGWWYIKNGMVDFSYNGFAGNEHGWWYLEGGKVSFKKNDVIEGTVNGKNGWWHVKGSKVVYDTTIAENEHGVWYIKKGMVDFSHNGIVIINGVSYTVKNGKVQP